MCIEEYDDNEKGRMSGNIDTRMFIYYDNRDKEFNVFGRRPDMKNSDKEYVPYHFVTSNKKTLFEFVDCVTGFGETDKSITLYNYNNMYDKDNIDLDNSYEFMEENMDTEYIISAYDNTSLTREHFMKYLMMLKNMM
jgi:hypothetical protein